MATLAFDPAARDMPSVAVVQAVAAEIDAKIDDLECTLEDVIDPKALNGLFAPTAAGIPRTPGDATVEFLFCDCTVTIYSEGSVVVTRRPAATDR
ncbi:HalOD1 output domain-containing protein [Halorientalis brevis]|uniref:HalOD1 output domain-containing protein n=1 Tax=Halorientalis brevis TaxID=1126241 RepID=A0ABD6C9Q8_9EURY|nr:HalOD1 output domain-containing protein [Halorientalis brevis]